MREEQWVFIDKFKRNISIKYELKKVILKSLINNNNILNSYKYIAKYKKTKIIRWANTNQQVNRCFKSGRQWSVNKLTRYSRFVFRKESYLGNIPGFKRASW